MKAALIGWKGSCQNFSPSKLDDCIVWPTLVFGGAITKRSQCMSGSKLEEGCCFTCLGIQLGHMSKLLVWVLIPKWCDTMPKKLET